MENFYKALVALARTLVVDSKEMLAAVRAAIQSTNPVHLSVLFSHLLARYRAFSGP